MARYGFRRDGAVWLSEHNCRDTIALFCHFGISMAVLACLQGCSPVPLWQRMMTLTSSLTEVVTEERIPGEVFFRVTRLGDISHLESAGERRSTAGLFPECYTGVDSTDPGTNLEKPWEL
jgi:probable phosphoglycerate mutase